MTDARHSYDIFVAIRILAAPLPAKRERLRTFQFFWATFLGVPGSGDHHDDQI